MSAPAKPVVPDQIVPEQIGRERNFRRVLKVFLGLAALGLAAHLVLLLWAQHEFTAVESLVAIHIQMFTHGKGLYYDFSHYPFTVSAYGPVFYMVTGALHELGLPVYQSGRGVSFAALLVSLWLCWKALGYVTVGRYARVAGLVLAASTANILSWGTVGQVDMLGCCLALAGFTLFLRYRESEVLTHLWLAGVCVVLAVFTKQTFVASGVTIAWFLFLKDRRRALLWISGVAMSGVLIALLMSFIFPNFLVSVLRTQLNPFSLAKLEDHLQYFVLTGCGLLIATFAGLRSITARTAPVFVYAALAFLVFLGTAPKVGSDLNYQMETMFLLSMTAAAGLDQMVFFEGVFSGRKATVTLLQAPLMLHLCLNLVLTGRNVLLRVVLEPARRQETAALQGFLEKPGRLYCEHYDSLVHYRGEIEVEPFPYALLVRAGMIDPAPVLRDLQTRKFATLVLGENVFEKSDDTGTDSVPRYAAHAAAIRENYRVVAKIPGPYGLFVYEPQVDPSVTAASIKP